MKVSPLSIDGLMTITPSRFGDERGWFQETWSEPRLSEAGLKLEFQQDNMSFSRQSGTLRGLHCQLAPFDQGKLVMVLSGAIRDVVVDVRTGSTSFGQHVAIELSEDNPTQLWVPSGFLHGFITLQPDTRVCYKVTRPYSKDHDRSVAWNDPDFNIDWGTDNPVLSDKDAQAPCLKDSDVSFS